MDKDGVEKRLLVDERVQFLSETIDLTPDMIVDAHKDGNYSVLCHTYAVAQRESEKLASSGVAAAVALPVTVALYRVDADLLAGAALLLTMLAAASYYQAALGIQACRNEVLARYAKSAGPSAPAP